MTLGTPATLAAKQATQTIPIVMIAVADPQRTGLVASFARPGGNITGLTILGPELAAKRLQLLKEVVPKVSRVAFLWNPDNPGTAINFESVQAGARTLGVEVQSIKVSSPTELESALAAMMREHPDAFMMTADPMHLLHAALIIDFVNKRRLPAMYQVKESAVAGGLMSYGPYRPDLFLRAATFVDKILKGAKPGDLPIEEPRQVRAGHQPQDREGPRPDDPAIAPAAGGSGDRVMDRRAFIAGIAVGLLAAPLAAEAQPAAKVARIGFLGRDVRSDRPPLRRRRSGKGCATSARLRVGTLSSTTDMAEGGSTGCPTSRPSWSGSRSDVIVTGGDPRRLAAQARHQDDPHRHGPWRDPVGERAHRQPRAPGRQRHRGVRPGGRDGRQTAGAAQGGRPKSLAGRRPLESGQPEPPARDREAQESRPGRWGCSFTSWRRRGRTSSTAPSRR